MARPTVPPFEADDIKPEDIEACRAVFDHVAPVIDGVLDPGRRLDPELREGLVRIFAFEMLAVVGVLEMLESAINTEGENALENVEGAAVWLVQRPCLWTAIEEWGRGLPDPEHGRRLMDALRRAATIDAGFRAPPT